MVPKIHKKGKSFRGAARYLLTDVDAKTAHRVAWTEVRNVASRNPETAWRVMAATAMDQDRLKAQAGVPNTGRKSKDHVLHFTLSWHQDESKGLSRQEMMRAANTVLQVMQAQEHQALVVCHTDKPQPHIHVIVNRVHPRDGRMLSSSFEKLKASRWAQKYEEERGKIYCEQRVINNAARRRDEFTRGKKDSVRHVHEMARFAANDNERLARLLEAHRKRAFELKQAERLQQKRHQEAWRNLEYRHKKLIEIIAKKTRQVIARNQVQIRDRFRPLWEAQFHEHQSELRQFEKQEAGAIGRMKNALRSIDFKALLNRSRAGDGKAQTIADAFRLLGDAGNRLQALKQQHDAQDRQLLARQKHQEAIAYRQRKAEQERYLADNRRRFEADRSSLVLTHAMERAKIRAQWHEKGRRMREEWKRLCLAERKARPLAHEFTLAAQGKNQERASDTRSPVPDTDPATRTRPSDLLPKAGSQQAARQIDEWDRLRGTRLDRDLQRNKDRDDGQER